MKTRVNIWNKNIENEDHMVLVFSVQRSKICLIWIIPIDLWDPLDTSFVLYNLQKSLSFTGPHKKSDCQNVKKVTTSRPKICDSVIGKPVILHVWIKTYQPQSSYPNQNAKKTMGFDTVEINLVACQNENPV